MFSDVLTLQWPPEVHPTQLRNFETQARMLRYRALGIACRDRSIRSLLLAHHMDDQAESALMRIAQLSYRSQSVRPMAESVVNLPETWGIHGVHESGLREFQHVVVTKGIRAQMDLHEARSRKLTVSREVDYFGFEEGGVKLYRPLLRFPKQRLEATCRQHQMQWIEDETNGDVTLTPRNAVRSLLRENRLPKALSKDSLLSFMTRMEARRNNFEGHAENLFAKTQILAFDLRSGRLDVRLPKEFWLTTSADGTPEPFKEQVLSVQKIKAAMLIKRLATLVTPSDRVLLSKVLPIVDLMVPERSKLCQLSPRTKNTLVKRSFQNVILERIGEGPVHVESNTCTPADFAASAELKTTLRFTRQPLGRVYETPQIVVPPAVTNPPVERYLRTPPIGRNAISYWSRWQLWDGRYWLRVSNKTTKNLVIRPLKEEDIARIKAEMPRRWYQFLREALAVAAPGSVRWTIPVIAVNDESDQVLSLPSFDMVVNDQAMETPWQIRYKHVDLGVHRDQSCIIK